MAQLVDRVAAAGDSCAASTRRTLHRSPQAYNLLICCIHVGSLCGLSLTGTHCCRTQPGTLLLADVVTRVHVQYSLHGLSGCASR